MLLQLALFAANWELVGRTILFTLLGLLILLSPLLVLIYIRWLAEEDKFASVVPEGRAKAIMKNNKFYKFIMNKSGHDFRGNVETAIPRSDVRYWDVVKNLTPQPKKDFITNQFDGIYWTGMPFVYGPYQYHMTWVEWNYAKDKDGKTSTEKTAISHDETINHILIQEDVYYVKIQAAESSEGVPVDINLLLTIMIVNPYKALFNVQDWLEAITNQVESDTRLFVGTKTVKELYTIVGDVKQAIKLTMQETTARELKQDLQEEFARYEGQYGAEVQLVQIQSVEPAGAFAQKYRDLMTKEYEATQEAKRIGIAAKAEAKRIKTIAAAEKERVADVLETVANIQDGADIYHSDQLGKLQKLTTYVVNRGGKKEGGTEPVISIQPSDKKTEKE